MSDQKNAVVVKDLYKSFKLPHEQSSGIKQMIVNFAKRKKGYETQRVLNGVSFEIKKGEFFGIVGRNGSGKSTLLKLLAGIYTPDKGLVQVNGSLTPFIELGVGFNPELTGRENVYMNGALLGFDNKQMDSMYDEIVTFAELEKFMDQKLKNYSSGMQVRLAFSIAIRAESDILLLDEVLAVGDEAFQKKCYDYFEELRAKNKTVILVTHDMTAVERFCTRAMLVKEGVVLFEGNPYEVSSAYSQVNKEIAVDATESEEKKKSDLLQKMHSIQIDIRDKNGKKTSSFMSGDSMTAVISWGVNDVDNISVGIVHHSGSMVYATGTYQENVKLSKSHEATYEAELNIAEGDYFLQVGLGQEGNPKPIVLVGEGPHFSVTRNNKDVRWDGLVKLDHRWR